MCIVWWLLKNDSRSKDSKLTALYAVLSYLKNTQNFVRSIMYLRYFRVPFTWSWLLLYIFSFRGRKIREPTFFVHIFYINKSTTDMTNHWQSFMGSIREMWGFWSKPSTLNFLTNETSRNFFVHLISVYIS